MEFIYDREGQLIYQSIREQLDDSLLLGKLALIKQVRRVAEEMSQWILAEAAQNPGRAMRINLIAPSCISFVLVLAAKSNSDKVTTACTFCDANIAFGQSVCPNCMKKYNIKSYDLGSDGCGCDR